MKCCVFIFLGMRVKKAVSNIAKDRLSDVISKQ